jgi:hypothetical protein
MESRFATSNRSNYASKRRSNCSSRRHVSYKKGSKIPKMGGVFYYTSIASGDMVKRMVPVGLGHRICLIMPPNDVLIVAGVALSVDKQKRKIENSKISKCFYVSRRPVHRTMCSLIIPLA